jgi:hypothetical protein
MTGNSRVLYALQPDIDVPPAALCAGPFEARFALVLSSLSPTLRSAAIAALNAPPASSSTAKSQVATTSDPQQQQPVRVPNLDQSSHCRQEVEERAREKY